MSGAPSSNGVCDQATEKMGRSTQHPLLYELPRFSSRLVANSNDVIQVQMEFLAFYHKLGYAVIPVEHGKKNQFLVKWKQLRQKPLSLRELEGWFHAKPLNMAVLTGRVSGNLTVLDFESLEACERFLPKWRELIGKTLAVKPSRGIHIHLRSSKPVRSRRYGELELCVKGEPGLVLVPPSLHPKGVYYTHVGASTVLEVSDLDETIRKRVEELQGKKQREPTVKVSSLPPEGCPPCLQLLWSRLMEDKEAGDPHFLRFAHASLALAAGKSIDQLKQEYSRLKNWDEKETTYQLQHIKAGAYIPPSCKTLREIGCCQPNRLCLLLKRKHPLSYISLFAQRGREREHYELNIKGGEK